MEPWRGRQVITVCSDFLYCQRTNHHHASSRAVVGETLEDRAIVLLVGPGRPRGFGSTQAGFHIGHFRSFCKCFLLSRGFQWHFDSPVRKSRLAGSPIQNEPFRQDWLLSTEQPAVKLTDSEQLGHMVWHPALFQISSSLISSSNLDGFKRTNHSSSGHC